MKQGRTDEMETRLGLRVLAYENITDRILFLRIGVTGDIMDDIERKVTQFRPSFILKIALVGDSIGVD